MGRRWFSASTVANHISHGCHPSSLTALARACWKSLRRPCFLPLKLDPKGFCALKPHLLLVPDHVMSQLSPIMSHLASQDAPDWEKFLVRVRRVCSCPGRWGVGRGCSGTRMTDSVMVCGCSPRQAVQQSWAASHTNPSSATYWFKTLGKMFKFLVPQFPQLSIKYNNSYLVELPWLLRW